jgi:hypothetical protein
MKWTRQRCHVAPQHLGGGCFEAFVGVRDDELDPAQPAARQLAQEIAPERLGFGSADIQAQHLAPAVAVDVDRDDGRRRDDAPAPAHLQIGRIEPHIRPASTGRW